jgi:pimeloyl-ACP methyl ester carboxylesterase
MAFHSNSLSIPGGFSLSYTDNGPVSGSDDYTTLIILHGSAFNGRASSYAVLKKSLLIQIMYADSFERLHEYSHSRNLRTVIFNRRDYAGSSKYTDSELEDLNQGKRVFLDRLAVQLAYAVKFFIDSGIPTISANRKHGGVAIMGWSMGCATAMSLFSDKELIPGALYDELKLYVKDLVFDDPPHLVFAYAVPDQENTYDPWTDPDCKTGEEKYENFKTWVSSFYSGHNLSTGKVTDLDQSKGSSNNTISKWSDEEFGKYYDQMAAVRSELPMYVRLDVTVIDALTVFQVCFTDAGYLEGSLRSSSVFGKGQCCLPRREDHLHSVHDVQLAYAVVVRGNEETLPRASIGGGSRS